MHHCIKRTVTGDVDDVVTQVRTRLEQEGFDVVCDIDASTTLHGGFDEERRYRLLGVSNPSLAAGLSADPDLGVLLPCNIAVYEDSEWETVVSAVNPRAMFSVVGDVTLDGLATEMSVTFDRLLSDIASANASTDAQAETESPASNYSSH